MAFVSLIDLVYPVGSIYISYNSTNPGTKFGGTWEPISGMIRGNTSVGSDGNPVKHTGKNVDFDHTHAMRFDLRKSPNLSYTVNNTGFKYGAGDASIPNYGICTHLSSWKYRSAYTSANKHTDTRNTEAQNETDGDDICQESGTLYPWFGTKRKLEYKTPAQILAGITYQDLFVWKRTA